MANCSAVFIVRLSALVIAFGFMVPCYYIGELLAGKGMFSQVLAFVLLSSIVSLPIMVTVNILNVI